MLIDKSLEKAIKRETKSGLTIYNNGSEIWFMGTGWVAKTTESQMRRELRGTLGAIVEMLGHMPEVGTITITKVEGEYIEQESMAEMAANTLDRYCGMIRTILEPTPLRFRGRVLFQAPNRNLYAQAVTPPDIITRETVLNEKGCMVRRSETSEDYVIAQGFRPEFVEDDTEWEYLERMMWVDFAGGAVEYPEDDDQMGMEEDL